MPITRLDITGIKCERNPDAAGGQVKIKTSVEPRKITKKKIDNNEFLLIDFALRTNYEPDIGIIEISGTVYYTHEDLKSKYTMEKGNVLINPEVAAEVAQLIYIQPAIIAVNLARELRLPLPIQFPRVELQKAPAPGKAK